MGDEAGDQGQAVCGCGVCVSVAYLYLGNNIQENVLGN